MHPANPPETAPQASMPPRAWGTLLRDAVQGLCPPLQRTGHHDTTQHSTPHRSTAHHITPQHGTAQHDAARRSTVKYSPPQHSRAQHHTTRHGTAQRSRAQHSTVQNTRRGTAEHSTARHGTAKHTTAPKQGTSTASQTRPPPPPSYHREGRNTPTAVGHHHTSPQRTGQKQPHARRYEPPNIDVWSTAKALLGKLLSAAKFCPARGWGPPGKTGRNPRHPPTAARQHKPAPET